MADELAEILKEKAKQAIGVHSSDLYDLSKGIWKNPQLNFKETYAHELLTKFLAGSMVSVLLLITLWIRLSELSAERMEV